MSLVVRGVYSWVFLSSQNTNQPAQLMSLSRLLKLGDYCIQIFHLGRYIVGYLAGNFVLRRCVNRAVKHDF